MKKFRGQPKLDEAAGRVQFGCQRNFLNPIISKLDKNVVLLLINYIAIGHCSVIEDITRWQEDMNFMFEWQELYLTSALREHKIHIFELTCNVNVLMTPFLTIFRRFPTTFRRFPKIFQICSEG